MTAYRDATRLVGTCPVCDHEVELNDITGCTKCGGAWIPQERFQLAELGEEIMQHLVGVTELQCPRCRGAMTRRYWEMTRFATCAEHGTFVEEDFAKRLLGNLDAAIVVMERKQQRSIAEQIRTEAKRETQEQRIAFLVEKMATAEGREAIARLVLELEARLDE